MDRFQPIAEPTNITVPVARSRKPLGLAFAGLVGVLGVGAAYYAGKLSGRTAVVIGSGSAVMMGVGGYFHLRQPAAASGKIALVPSKPFFNQAAFNRAIKGEREPDADDECKAGKLTADVVEYGGQIVGLYRSGVPKAATPQWEKNLQLTRAVCKKFKLDHLLVYESELTEVTDSEGNKHPAVALKGPSLTNVSNHQPDRLKDNPEFQKTCYQLATFIVQTGWSNVRPLLMGSKVAIPFVCDFGDTVAGLQHLLKKVPLNIAEGLVPLLPESLRGRCESVVSPRVRKRAYFADKAKGTPVDLNFDFFNAEEKKKAGFLLSGAKIGRRRKVTLPQEKLSANADAYGLLIGNTPPYAAYRPVLNELKAQGRIFDYEFVEHLSDDSSSSSHSVIIRI